LIFDQDVGARGTATTPPGRGRTALWRSSHDWTIVHPMDFELDRFPRLFHQQRGPWFPCGLWRAPSVAELRVIEPGAGSRPRSRSALSIELNAL
jgi:hypothetical protein